MQQQVGNFRRSACRDGASRPGGGLVPQLRGTSSRVVLPRASSSAASSAPASPPAPKPRPAYIPNRIDDPTYVRIFDTTLRDGEQSPGATMTSKEKMDIAKQLAKARRDLRPMKSQGRREDTLGL